MKVFVSLLLACLLALAPCLAEEIVSGNFRYVVREDDTATIVGYEGEDEAVDIPAELDGHPVTGIGNYAFYNARMLKRVELPDTLRSIGECAFGGCGNLESLRIPGSVTSIGAYPFQWCYHLSYEIAPENPVFSIVDGALVDWNTGTLICYPCDKPAASLTIPEGITTIGECAFNNCELEEIIIPEGVTTIERGAFTVYGLTEVVIPGSVVNWGMDCFSGCDDLVRVVLSDGVEIVPEDCFFHCDSLAEVFLPATVKVLDMNAFTDCIALSDIVLPEGLQEIRGGCFENCTSLQSLRIPESVSLIEDNAFDGCDALTLTVVEGSYAWQFAQEMEIPFVLDGQE